MYILNAFSLQMVEIPSVVRFTEVEELPQGLVSAIGHADTAAVLGYPVNRCNVSLKPGDVAYVAQLQGGRLPEGCTTLPEGFTFKFIKVEIGEQYADNKVSFAKTVLRTTASMTR